MRVTLVVNQELENYAFQALMGKACLLSPGATILLGLPMMQMINKYQLN